MNKLRSSLKYIPMMLEFSFCVFLIMVATLFLIFSGAQIMVWLGIWDRMVFSRFPLFSFCLISTLLETVLAFLFSRIPLKPLRELIEATDRIADGDYSVRIDLKGPDEVRRLSQKFNHMAEEIGSVEMLRTDFVNNFSHEFKTPIVSIRGFAKALKWDDLTEQEREEYLDIIAAESERLASLSTNVLYLSKLEKQSILTDKKRYDLSEQLRQVVALLDRKLSEKRLTLIFDSAEYAEYFVVGNEEMLKQVWINLLDNAIKFSPDGGKIEVTISQGAERTCISISNEGEGIAPEAQAHIFDKFYQADTSHATAGSGLGLAIVKKIIDLHKGEIEVVSANGTTAAKVCLLLPRRGKRSMMYLMAIKETGNFESMGVTLL